MSDTPRTDAETFDPYPWNQNGPGRSCYPEVRDKREDGEWVPSDFARGLERELEQAKQDAKQSELDCLRALGERNDERALADRLADALRMIERRAGDLEFGSADFRKWCRYDVPKYLATWKEARGE